MQACQRGEPHGRVPREESEALLPKVEMDYCFFSRDAEKQVASCLVMLDCELGAMAAAAVPKAVTTFVADFVEGVIDNWGRTDIILITDQGLSSSWPRRCSVSARTGRWFEVPRGIHRRVMEPSSG